MNWKLNAIALAALSTMGCDSGLAYKADLGQHAQTYLLDVTVGVPGATGQVVTVAPHPGGAILPAEWLTAKSIKIGVGSNFYSLASTATGSLTPTSTLTTVVAQPPYLSKPLDSQESTMSFLINNDHVMAARVTFI